MAHFDWIPYLQGKYLSYYQWFALLISTACVLISFLCFFIYLVLCRIYPTMFQQDSNKSMDRIKSIFFNAGFIWLSIIPLTLSALDVIWLVSGCIGMMTVFAIGVYLDNGRKKMQAKERRLMQTIQQDNSEAVGQRLVGMSSSLQSQRNYNTAQQLEEFASSQKEYSQSSSSQVTQRPAPKHPNHQQYLHHLHHQRRLTTWSQYLQECLKLDKDAYKRLKTLAIISIVLPFLMYRTCICFYNDQIGYYNHLLGFGINTCFTRHFQLRDSCPKGFPCHVYATVPQNPTEAFFLNIHTHTSYESVDVFYQELYTQNVTEFKKVKASTFEYYGLEARAKRNVHTALITDLKPNTRYLTIVSYDNQNWTNNVYKTLPNNKSTPIRMINAGDSGYTEAAVKLSKIVATLSPDIFFIAGDIAYDDNMPACAYTWDYFLNMYENICSSLGYMMPIVASVGNHDVGLNELPGVNITVNNYGPAYHIYFPQHYAVNSQNQRVMRVPRIQHRRTILNYTFGNVHYLALDSGYMHSFDGYQKKFMIESFQANKDKIKFVNYHVPIYSVCENFDKSPMRFLYALFHWVPNFDKYKVMTSFENHVHAFKRTKPLIGSSPSDTGTVYLGDGAYGAIPTEFCKPDVTIDIFDSYAKQKNNFWLSEIRENQVQHWAYGTDGKVLDHFVQKVDKYKLNSEDITAELNKHQISMEQAEKIAKQYYSKQENAELPDSYNILNS